MNTSSMVVRSPAVAGLFYPADAQQLAETIDQLLAGAEKYACQPKALIVPHAGYVYSGTVAAVAYAGLRATAHTIERVVLLGPAHRVAIAGMALPIAKFFETPLGRVSVDQELVAALAHLPQVLVSADAHLEEHALEVQLPFLQKILGDFTVLPLVVGDVSAAAVTQMLEQVWGGAETLIVISSDLSHYLPYATAQQTDQATVQQILQLRQLLAYEQACGSVPINGLLLAAQKYQLTPHLLDLRNSGDTAGSHDQVVGYAAIAFNEKTGGAHEHEFNGTM